MFSRLLLDLITLLRQKEYFHSTYAYLTLQKKNRKLFMIFSLTIIAEKDKLHPFQASVAFLSLPEKCPYSEFFWPVYSCIQTEYRKIRSISPYSVQMQENTGPEKLRIRALYAVHTKRFSDVFKEYRNQYGSEIS